MVDVMEINKEILNEIERFEQCGTHLDVESFVSNLKEILGRSAPEGFILLPIEPSEAIKTALSYQCFDFIKVAQVYRNLGFDIPKKAEEEQSFFLHKFLILAIKHGNDFIKVFNAETKAMVDVKGLNS